MLNVIKKALHMIYLGGLIFATSCQTDKNERNDPTLLIAIISKNEQQISLLEETIKSAQHDSAQILLDKWQDTLHEDIKTIKALSLNPSYQESKANIVETLKDYQQLVKNAYPTLLHAHANKKDKDLAQKQVNYTHQQMTQIFNDLANRIEASYSK